MDHTDKMIIDVLQKNARIPLKALAEKVFLSSPAVASRVEKLEREGIITGYHAQLDQLQLGYHITAFINLEMDPVRKPEFYPLMQACPYVLECNCVTGPYAMLIKVAFPSTGELDSFIGQLQKFGKTSTQIVFSTSVYHRGVNIYALDKEENNLEIGE
ncbi:Lrp/AsnC family transcriptional regulator [Scatolibacter rhodanostii]|uniref:Lrp/AsnC family transcriptional regulator n=1 Tax=Scatolibacter rhodanostii TaxID=2014781 RepID=UPI001FA8EA78|nr:Lrp/AsnC family transcriptional regulator [Scatolibacter rhodanostii]